MHEVEAPPGLAISTGEALRFTSGTIRARRNSGKGSTWHLKLFETLTRS